MRGARHDLSRRSASRPLLAATTLLIAASLPFGARAASGGTQTSKTAASASRGGPAPAKGGAESVAYAVPRAQPPNGQEVVLARPLAPSDVALYRRIFADQAAGHLAEARHLEQRVQDKLLMGQVLAQLYLGPYHHSTPQELAAWLRKYNGQPNSVPIRALLLRRLPKGAKTPPPAKVAVIPPPARTDVAGVRRQAAPNCAPGWLAGKIERLARDGRITEALGIISRDDHISKQAGADLRGEVARQLIARGDIGRAYDVARHAAREGGGAVWRPDFMAGLAAWQKHDIAAALPFFAEAAHATEGSAAERAAGAFWAARAALRERKPDVYLDWLQQAAKARDTFYGMLAARLLGRGPDGVTGGTTLSEADVEAVDGVPDGRLAFGLIQVGRDADAAAALKALWPAIQRNHALGQSVLRVAARAGFVDVAVALRQALPANDEVAGVALPLPSLHPLGGFKVDPALIYALARIESGFDPHAVSAVGARGLMQLMPQTARAMARRHGIHANLRAPSVNLALGQSYVVYLSGQPDIGGNLVKILASYNAGPAAAASWDKAMRDDSDPLMFIESIPVTQTRRFVQQVLTDSWIYAEEIGTAPHSLDALAEGRYPSLPQYRHERAYAEK